MVTGTEGEVVEDAGVTEGHVDVVDGLRCCLVGMEKSGGRAKGESYSSLPYQDHGKQ